MVCIKFTIVTDLHNLIDGRLDDREGCGGRRCFLRLFSSRLSSNYASQVSRRWK